MLMDGMVQLSFVLTNVRFQDFVTLVAIHMELREWYGFLCDVNGVSSPASSSVKSWDLSGHEVSYYAGTGQKWWDGCTDPIKGCADSTSSLETFANQTQYQMKVFQDKKDVSHLIPNWIPEEVANKIFE